jgi:hypothetical protein
MKNTRRALLVSLGLIALVARPVQATDVITTYTINFTTTSGAAPASGSFSYDSTNPQFTNFIVNWDGFSFDLTSSANSPSVGPSGCPGEASTPLYGFELITQTIPTSCGQASVSYIWGATTPGPGASFVFEANANSQAEQIAQVTHDIGQNPADAVGSWAVSTAAVSEPSSLILLGSALGLMVSARRKLRLRLQISN